MLKPLNSIERRILKAARKDAGTKDTRHLRKLKMGMELWYLVNHSLVDKGFANWTEPADFADALVGEQSDVLTPGLISLTARGREALKANTLPKRTCRAIGEAMPRLVWVVLSPLLAAAIGAAVTACVTTPCP